VCLAPRKPSVPLHGWRMLLSASGQLAGLGTFFIGATKSGSGDSSITVVHTPYSGVSVAAVTDSSSYRQGDFVILSALVFNGTTPVTQASVHATIGAFVPVSGTIGNYQLTDQQQVDSTYTRYT
jgi:hypothetical protein